MAKLQRSITAMLLMLVMLLTLAFPALAAAGETIWQGNDVSLSFVRGEDPYVYAIAQDPANNRWYYETSNHTLKKEVTGGGAVHIFPIVDTTKVTGPWDPEGSTKAV